MTATVKNPVRYGGFTRPRAVGIADMSLPATLALLADLWLCIQLMGFVPGWAKILLIAQLLVFLIACLFRNADGVSLWTRVARRMKFNTYAAAGVTEYKPAMIAAKGQANVLSSTVALEYETALGVKFCLLHYPFSQQYALGFICRPNGGERLDTEERNQRTTNWAGFGNALADIMGAAQFTVSVDSAASSQIQARRQMENFIHPDAPIDAQEVTRERLAMGNDNHLQNTTWVTVTFNAVEKGTSTKAREANAMHIARHLHIIQQQLSICGAGKVTPATERDFAEYMRAMLDPEARPLIEAAHADGEDTGLTWENCGPTYLKPSHEYLIHDQAVSTSLIMVRPPAGLFPDTVLKDMIAPRQDIEVKRVTLIFQVIDPGLAETLTRRDIGNAENRRQIQRRSSAAKREHALTERTADEIHEGFSLLDFTIVTTVTVTDPAKLKSAITVMRGTLGNGAGIRLSIATEQQDKAFWYGGPFGLDLHGHSVAEQTQRAATTAH